MTIKSVSIKRNYPRERDILQWSADRGILHNSTAYAQYGKLEEEFEELGEGLENRDKSEIRDAIGDMYVVMTNIAALKGLTMDECVEAAWEEIKDRKGYLNSDGVFVKEVA